MLARNLGLGALLSELKDGFGGYEIIDHWHQGEFHHDVVLKFRGCGRRARAAFWWSRPTATAA